MRQWVGPPHQLRGRRGRKEAFFVFARAGLRCRRTWSVLRNGAACLLVFTMLRAAVGGGAAVDDEPVQGVVAELGVPAHSDKIGFEEFRQIVLEAGIRESRAESRLSFAGWDANGDGVL